MFHNLHECKYQCAVTLQSKTCSALRSTHSILKITLMPCCNSQVRDEGFIIAVLRQKKGQEQEFEELK
jgi:hypothetical protein